MKFQSFQQAVEKQFKKMSENGLFIVKTNDAEGNHDKNMLWDAYMKAFPAGSNPIYRTRAEHDCNCCKNFIRNVGNVVTWINGKRVSIWDVKIPGEPEYQIVADAMAELVNSLPLGGFFMTTEPIAGREKTIEYFEGKSIPHNHFFANIPAKYQFKKDNIGTHKSTLESSLQVFKRSLEEFTIEAVETTIDLINQGSLYRGNEFINIAKEFLVIKKKYDSMTPEMKVEYLYKTIDTVNTSAMIRIRNTAFGQLLIDLSNGVDIEESVSAFERIMAPSNYKRPKSIVTEKMVKDAKSKLEDLGYMSALSRRHAQLNDITVDNILFADSGVLSNLADTNEVDDVFASVAKTSKKTSFDRVETITIDKFINDVLPTVKGIEILLENSHASRMVSLIAPQNATSKGMFNWNNNFSWSYVGDVTDSLKERVKKAGGNVTGEFCCRLGWYNTSDLDFHMKTPKGEIYYANRGAAGGKLDVDMNAGWGTTNEPVENIFFDKISSMPNGEYELFVKHFNLRNMKNPGFEVAVDICGVMHTYYTDKFGAESSKVSIAKFKKVGNTITIIDGKLGENLKSREIWGITTNNFHRVNVVMKSPNYWDGQVGIGNKHIFFMIDKCVNEESARGFYNEFLRPELNEHRKVMEIVGGKMRTEVVENQLSGIGFSDTGKGEVTLKLHGAVTRIVKVAM